jgi:hypothetical protein
MNGKGTPVSGISASIAEILTTACNTRTRVSPVDKYLENAEVFSMNTDILRKLGLDSNEIRVYLSLLEIGQTTTGPKGTLRAIIREIGITRDYFMKLVNE